MKSASISAESAHEIPGRAHGDRIAAIPVPPVGAGETIVLLTWNARPRTGRLHRLNSLEGIVSFSPLDGDEVHEVALAGIKAVHVHGAGIAGGLPAAEADDDRDLLPEERDFQIEFRDGDRLTGRTAGFCADHGGVYLFPIADGIDAVCTFVPHAAAASVHVGPPLGEVLVDEGLLDADDVTAALAAQKARREEPLGAALARQGAVTIMEIEKALEQQRDLPHLKIGQILIEEGLVQQQPNVASSRKLSDLLSEYCAPFAGGHDEGMAHKDRELERWARQFSNMEGDFRLYRAVGCDECGGTGYEGRLGLHELFVASEDTKSLIRRMAPVPELRALALEQGMRTLKQDGIEKVLYGLTDMRQVRAVCPD